MYNPTPQSRAKTEYTAVRDTVRTILKENNQSILWSLDRMHSGWQSNEYNRFSKNLRRIRYLTAAGFSHFPLK